LSEQTAKALDISRYTLIRYLKADEELRNSFDDVKLNEIDDVRAPKALAVALSFCRLLGLGCPKQAFAKIATPRI
jgi:hypothetical protein